MSKSEMIEIAGFKNTSSSAGRTTKYEINPLDVVRVNVWCNCYGNPSLVFFMDNGDTYFLVDSYGAMNGINHIISKSVKRKKDLFNRFYGV